MLSIRKFYSSECQRYDPDVLILIDHVSREMEFAKSLRDYLTHAGMHAEIVTTKFNIYRLPFLYKCKYLITPWVYKNREAEIFSSIKGLDQRFPCIINLHFEQIAGKASDRFLLPTGKAKDVLHLAWSNDFAKQLLEESVEDATILRLGNPKLDIYRRAKANRSSNQVLIVGNAFHLLTSAEKRRFESAGINMSGIGVCGVQTFEGLMSILPEILEEYSHIEFLYRPHPSFSSRDLVYPDLVELENSYVNFRLEFSGPISDCLINSSLVVSFHSTVYLEAVACGIPFSTLRFVDLPVQDDLEDLVDWPLNVNSLGSFRHILDLVENSELERTLEQKYKNLETRYFMTSERTVTEKLGQLILSDKLVANEIEVSLKRKVTMYVLFLAKFTFNYCSIKFPFVRKLLLGLSDYRLQNLAYMWGEDAFRNEDIL